MGNDPPDPVVVPCIICGQPATPAPSQEPVCSAQCDARLAYNVALIVDLLLLADQKEERRTSAPWRDI